MDYTATILQKLLYNPALRFSDLQIEELTSKHFNYYLQKLLDDELIEKKDNKYFLTHKGKDFVGRVDEKNMNVEKQPKTSVAMFVERTNKDGIREALLNKRLKQPYYGKVGGFTGKLRFGEKLEVAARRELMEETGLSGDFRFCGVRSKMAYKGEQKEIVQDQLMMLFHVTNPTGKLIEKTKENENFWVPVGEIEKRDDLFNTFLTFLGTTLENESEDIEVIVPAEGY